MSINLKLTMDIIQKVPKLVFTVKEFGQEFDTDLKKIASKKEIINLVKFIL